MPGKTERVQLKFTPHWKGEIEGFVVKFLSKNMWRVSKMMEYEDALQESYVVFLGCAEYYRGKVDNPAWFMALFKRSLFNRFNDFSRKAYCLGSEVQYTEAGYDLHKTENSLGEFQFKLEQAPAEIKQVLEVLFGSPQEVLNQYKNWRRIGRKGEASNKFLCSLISADPGKINLVKQLKEYFA